MAARTSFVHVVVAVFVLAFVAGFTVFVVSGASTDKGTTGAISAEYVKIMAAEKASCARYGHYSSIAALRSEGLLDFEPLYNSVVYLPGAHCGSIIVGSASYQSAAG
ncbi:MAG TPA: hypothetical protein VMD59_13280 [Acidimicrobiales bacterium]|nr:hypothetical protein [Acidimicrobiales bacterium]